MRATHYTMQEPIARILFIDDDVELVTLLSDYLAMDDMVVTPAHSGADGLQKFDTGVYDLVVLDVMMPGLNGIEVLRLLREKSPVPILMLTARGDPVDRIVGLELGADDYVPKPCPPRELSARIQAILRRTRHAVKNVSELTWGELRLDTTRRQCRYQDTEIPLTGTEFSILQLLVQAGGDPVAKETLYLKALGRVRQPKDRTIDVHVSSIRRKLAVGTRGTLEITNRRNVGYLLIDTTQPDMRVKDGEA